MYPLRFCRSFEFKYFWFPQFGRTEAPMGVGFRGVRWRISDLLQIALQSPLVLLWFATVFNVFLITSTLGESN